MIGNYEADLKILVQELVDRWAEKPTIQQVLLILWFHRVGGGPGAAAASHEICQKTKTIFSKQPTDFYHCKKG